MTDPEYLITRGWIELKPNTPNKPTSTWMDPLHYGSSNSDAIYQEAAVSIQVARDKEKEMDLWAKCAAGRGGVYPGQLSEGSRPEEFADQMVKAFRKRFGHKGKP